jgi:hypothetical protein
VRRRASIRRARELLGAAADGAFVVMPHGQMLRIVGKSGADWSPGSLTCGPISHADPGWSWSAVEK